MQQIELFQPFRRKSPPRGQRFIGHVAAHAFDNIARLFQIKGSFNNLGPASRIFLRQIFFRHPRQIELNGGIEHIHIVIQPLYLSLLTRLAMDHLAEVIHHELQHITHAQGFTRRIRQRQCGRIQRATVEMFRLQTSIVFLIVADQPLAQTRHRIGKWHHNHAPDQVVKNVEENNQLFIIDRQLIQPRRQHMYERQHQHAADRFK